MASFNLDDLDWDTAEPVEPTDDGLDWSTAAPLDKEDKRRLAKGVVVDFRRTEGEQAIPPTDPVAVAKSKLKTALDGASFIDELTASAGIPLTDRAKDIRAAGDALAEARKTTGDTGMQLGFEVPVLSSKPSPISRLVAAADAVPALDRADKVKQILGEDYSKYRDDAVKEDWDTNPKGYNIRYDGEFTFSPALLKDREKFSAALTDAKIEEPRKQAALELFDQNSAAERAGLIELAKKTKTFQNFAASEENKGKTDEEVFSAFEKSKNWRDWVSANVVSVPKSAVSYSASLLAGATFGAAALTEAKANDPLAKAARAISDWSANLTPNDVRYTNTLGDTIGQFAPQIATQLGLGLALRKFGVNEANSELVSKAFTAISSGAQIGAENYRTVFEANKDEYGVDKAHDMAMKAFRDSVPLGVSELLSLESILAKSPKGLGWKAVKTVASAVSEVGTEQFQNAMSNVINKRASAAYVEPQTMGLGDSLEMGAGTALVDLAVGGGQRVLQNRMEAQVKAEAEKLKQKAAETQAAGAPQTAEVLAKIAADKEANAAEEARKLAAEILSSEDEADPAEVQPIARDGGTTTAVEADPNADVLRDFGIKKSPTAAPGPVAAVEPTVEKTAPAVEQPAERLGIKTGLPVEPPVPAVEVAAPEPAAPAPILEEKGGENSGESKTNDQKGQGRQEVLTPAESDGAALQGNTEPTALPATEGAAPSSAVTFSGAKGVISGKPLPVREVTSPEGVTTVEPGFVNDPDTMAEVLSQTGGASRVYIPDEILDSEDPADQIDTDKIDYAFEKETGRAYVTSAKHSRYDSPILADGKTESGQTLEDLYQQDETRKKNSAAQTERKAVGLPEETEAYTAKVDKAPASKFEAESPDKFQANLVRISELAAGLAGETYVTNDGVTATIGPTMAERIGAAAVSKYRARLRGVETGKANPAAVVADIKKKILPALKARVSETSGVSLDQEVGDGGDTLGSITKDAPAQTQAQTDLETPQPAEQVTGNNAPTGPKSLADTARQAQAEVLAGMPIEEQAILEEAIRRKTERDAKGRQKPLTKEQKESFAKAESKIKARVKELLSAETPEDYDDKSGIPIASAPTPAGNQDVVNTNAEELLRLSGGIDGVYQGLPTLLRNIASDTSQSPWVRTIAKMLVKMNIDFSGVVIQPVNSLNRQWAGLYTAVVDSASQGIISLNLAHPHEGSLGQTIVHEALHHISLYKLERGFKRNAVEQAAYRDLVKILTHVRRKIVVPASGQTLSQAASEVSSQARTFYGIKNLKELFAEAFSNPEFAAWLSGQRAIPGIKTKGGLRPTLWEQLKYLIKKWVTGVDVRPDSLLAQALDSMFALTATPATDEQVVEYNTRGVVESSESRAASTTLRDVAEQMPIDTPAEGELVDTPRDNTNPRLVERALQVAGEAFKKVFGKTVVAVDGRKIVIQRKGENLLQTFRHITKDNTTDAFNMQKVRSVPAIEATLKNATARLRDADNGTLHYIRRIGKDEWHTVVVRPDGSLEDQTVTTRLSTQFTLGRQDGVFRLPVDREEKGLALWRVNTPLGQSGDPGPSPQKEGTTGGGGVQQKRLANPVGAAASETQNRAGQIRALVEDLRISPHIPVTYATVNGSPAAATLDEAGNMEITIDPAALDYVTFGLNEQETRDVVEAYIRHETIHVAGFMGDYRIPDAQGRIGKEKLDAFHDEVLTPEMRQEVADTYVRQLPEESDEAFAARKAEFLANKISVVAEYKRMFAERYLNGSAQEDVLDAIEAKTGNAFGDFLRGIMDYIRAKLRWMEARWQATRDPRIKAEVLTDLRNLELLSDRSGATLDQLMYRDDLQRQAKWLNEQAVEEGNKSFDTAPFELQMQLASEWRESHPESIVEGFYRSQPVNLPERAETAGDALLRLADERGGDLFSFKNPLSDSTDLATVLDSIGTEFSVTNAAGGLFISTRQSAQIGDPVTISTGQDTYTAGDLLARDETTSTIRRYDNGQTVTVPTAQVSDANKAVFLREDQPGEWVIDSSMGSLDESAKAYQAIYQWAANSGVKIVPDTATSWEGNYRRNAHQLSSALRQQSANHFTPTDDQLGRMFPQAAAPMDAWTRSSTAERIEALLRAEASYVEQALPGIVKFDYDFRTNTIREAGKGLDRRQFGQRLRAEVSGTQTSAGLSDPKRVGIRTALRYLAAKSIIRGDAGGSVGSTGDLGTLKGVFYASPARRAQMRKRNLGGWKLSGLFQQGDMDMRVFNLIQAKNAGLRGDSFRAKEIAKKFNRLVAKHNPDVKDLQEALGTTDNRLTDAQAAQYDTLKKAAKREKDPTKRRAALSTAENYRAGEIRANIAAATARSQAALAKLPKELADVVRTMRDDIKALNNTMINSGMLSGPMSVLVDENKEVYLNRSYEIFDNPEWADFILNDPSPDSVMIRNKMANLSRAQLIAQKAKEIRRAARLANTPVPSQASALATASTLVTPDDVQNLMLDYLRVADKTAGMTFTGQLAGKQDTRILKMRGQIPKEIRDFWGEYKDPGVNYARTFMKLSAFVADHNFQQDLLDIGLKAGFLWKEGVSTGSAPLNWVSVYGEADGKPHPTPMAGVRAPEIVAEAIQEAGKIYKVDGVQKAVMALTGWAMASKTVYNIPQSNVRNFVGNFLIMTANGYVTQDWGSFKRLGTAASTVAPQSFGLRLERKQDVVDYVERLTRLNIMGDNVKANVVKTLTDVVFDRDPGTAWSRFQQKAFNALKDVNERATEAYGAVDDFWKIFAFETELALMQKAFPAATSDEHDRMAADRVVRVVPTYSRIPAVVQNLVKKQPYFAPFISWTSEIMRVSANSLLLATEDMRSGNKTLQASGVKRMLSFLASNALLGVLASAVRDTVAGMSDDDEDDLRRFLPEWQKKALLMMLNKTADGKVSFVDLSFLNPFSILQEPFIAAKVEMGSTGNPFAAAGSAAQSLLKPWTSEQLFFGELINVLRGVDADGRKLWEPADSSAKKIETGALRLLGTTTPGTVNIARRIWMAAEGTVTPSGRSYNLANELLGPVVGQRISQSDTQQTFDSNKIGAFLRMQQSATSLATQSYRNRGTIDAAEIRRQYDQSNFARLASFINLHKDIEAARRLGVPEEAIMRSLARVPANDRAEILNGVYRKYVPSPETIRAGVSNPQGEERRRVLLEAIEAYPNEQVITPPTDD